MRYVYVYIMLRVGQNHTFIGMYGVHTVFLAEITIHTVIYGADVRFWPTLIRYTVNKYMVNMRYVYVYIILCTVLPALFMC
jgi:hypothetical protein